MENCGRGIPCFFLRMPCCSFSPQFLMYFVHMKSMADIEKTGTRQNERSLQQGINIR